LLRWHCCVIEWAEKNLVKILPADTFFISFEYLMKTGEKIIIKAPKQQAEGIGNRYKKWRLV